MSILSKKKSASVAVIFLHLLFLKQTTPKLNKKIMILSPTALRSNPLITSQKLLSKLRCRPVTTSLQHANFPRNKSASMLSAGTVLALGHCWKYKKLRFGFEWLNLYTPFLQKDKQLPDESTWSEIIDNSKIKEDLQMIDEMAHLGLVQLFVE